MTTAPHQLNPRPDGDARPLLPPEVIQPFTASLKLVA